MKNDEKIHEIDPNDVHKSIFKLDFERKQWFERRRKEEREAQRRKIIYTILGIVFFVITTIITYYIMDYILTNYC